MLIVNADDWGRSIAETDAALACFSRGRVTSVTAMTFMADSKRAADIALKHSIPIGLHINLIEPLTDRGLDPALVAQQRTLSEALNRRLGALVPTPLLLDSCRRTFASQLQEFMRLYGKCPTHFDGHRHFHLCSSMLLAAPIPKGERVRRTFSFTVQEKGLTNWLYRRALDRWVVRRYRTTDYFFALSQQMHSPRLAHVALLARDAKVELMTHPVISKERDVLLGEGFSRATAGITLESYAAL